jgi:phosphatidylinositol 3-kinase
VDATAKPNKSEKETIDKAINAVGSHMTLEEIELLYRYRYSLTENKKALVKFLFIVNWDEEAEVPRRCALLCFAVLCCALLCFAVRTIEKFGWLAQRLR